MNRAIKFRAYYKASQCMCEVTALEFDRQRGIVSIELVDSDNQSHLIEDGFELMQFTGLQDNRGRGIYESDILGKIGEPRTVYQIVWDDANGAWACQDSWGSRAPLSEDPIGSNDIVLGNIYENPELMKASNQ